MNQPQPISDDPSDAPLPSAAIRPRRWWFPLAAIGLALVGCLLAAELLLRVFEADDDRERFVRHPKWHHWQRAEFDLRVHGAPGEFGGHVVHFNRDGLAMQRELPAPDAPALVFLGDSFTAGIEQPETERFVSLVGERLSLPAVNLGCASFSPLLSRLLWEDFAPRLAPRVVVLQLYSNDIDGDVQQARAAERNDTGTIVAAPHREPIAHFLIHTSAVYRAAKQFAAARRFARQQQARAGGDWQADPWSPAFTAPLDECFSAEALAVTEQSILEIARLSAARGARFFLLAIPDRGALRIEQTDFFSEHWRAFAQREELAYIDLSTTIKPANVREMFFPRDIHLTARGHVAVAEAVVAALHAAGVEFPAP